MTFRNRGMEIEIHAVANARPPILLWEDMCLALRGLLDYEEKSPPGEYVDQLFKIYVGRHYLAIGRIRPPNVMSS